MTRATVTDRATSGWKAWYGLGEAERLRGRWEDALLAHDRAHALNPRSPDVSRGLEAAVAEARRHGAEGPRLDRAEGRLRAARGDLDGALAHLRRALERDATDPATLLATGDVLLAMGAHDEATDAFRAVLAYRPESAEARRGLQAAQAARG